MLEEEDIVEDGAVEGRAEELLGTAETVADALLLDSCDDTGLDETGADVALRLEMVEVEVREAELALVLLMLPFVTCRTLIAACAMPMAMKRVVKDNFIFADIQTVNDCEVRPQRLFQSLLNRTDQIMSKPVLNDCSRRLCRYL